ncbi:LITAF domain-containing protein [Caenorhabditis elegans]|uniref:LITAF domain-containing protein n=1 Tax=Caenorhabditis elegans TaxID=6239 RepID=D3KFU9_CAEEL|nr:LITAF domain-containing protein [Caenorhabditis elegans]CBJ25086.1 LITAF domain-containing protein [Caenorhabditis elegans]|eukprot:NP_001255682.1 Uncharacterized protein CELE_K08D8.12 [Caenorhabditis elegans]
MEPQAPNTYQYPTTSHFEAPPAYSDSTNNVYPPTQVAGEPAVIVVVPQNQFPQPRVSCYIRCIPIAIFMVIVIGFIATVILMLIQL